MTVTLIPDLEKVVGDFLRNRAEIAALDARIVGQTPSSTETPWVRITQLDASKGPNSPIDHLVSYLIQLDCYAGKHGIEGSQQKEASLLARTVRAVLHDELPGVRDGVVITRANALSMPRIPDQVDEPVRERFVLTMEIFAHAV